MPLSTELSLYDDARSKARVHTAFANAGRQAGVEIWRIQDFEPVAVAAKDFGKFHKGDSYIVLKTTADKRNNLSWNIHYWIGSESTQDESGPAAILTVGLDDKFNGAAIQHRETLGHESQQFKSYFPSALQYLNGGHRSGFNHVVTNPGAEKRLIQIKGTRNIRMRQVDPLIASMNKGDVFILDVGNDVYVYVGEKAKNAEKLKAISMANQIRDQDHNGRARVEIFDQYSSEVDIQKFFTALGSGAKDSVPEESAGGDDQAFERSEEQSVILSEVSDSSGSIKVTPLSKPFRQEQLKPQGSYILDTISGSIYVWTGKQSSPRDARSKARVHTAFANAGRQAGVEIWRIQDFEPVAVAAKDFGKFHKGDSYIVLKTTADKRNNLSWNIHYWIGSESTQDESGPAAILTVGLDDKFNGAAIQHRETLGHESQQFKSYFPSALQYLNGGHSSGFNHVVTNPGAEKRLIQIKGKRNIRMRQVDPLIASMNKGDVFILDVGNDVYVNVGEKAKNAEKLKAISVANQIRDQDHNGRAHVEIFDQYSSEVDIQKFFTALGSGAKDSVPEESAGGDDQAFERSEEQSVILSEVSDSSGSIKVTPLSKPFRQEQLKPQGSYILDTISGSIYVWTGKQSSPREKTEAMTKAQQLLTSKNYPSWVKVVKIPQGTEPAVFKHYFATWRDVGMSHSRIV